MRTLILFCQRVRCRGRASVQKLPQGACVQMSKTKKGFLSKAEVRALIKLSYAETSRREKAGKFPKRLRLGDYQRSRAVYVEDEIDDWMAEQIAKRD